MDFNLTTEQKMIKNLAREFRENEIEPVAAKMDRDGELPPDMVKKLVDAGLVEMTVSAEWGGPGADEVSKALAAEELGKSGTGVYWMTSGSAKSIEKYGTPEQKEKYLKKLCSGELASSLLFTEESTGSDATMIKTTVAEDGNDYVINGSKVFVTNGAFDGPGIVFANDSQGRESAIIVDKNCPGYSVSKRWELMGFGGWQVNEVILENVRTPKSNLFYDEFMGYTFLLQHIAVEKIPWAAVMVGVAQAALDDAILYSKQRFRRTAAISTTESIQYYIAEMATLVEAARWLVYRAASMMDEGAMVIVESSMAKLFATDVAVKVADMALQVHGCYGYVKDLKIERLYRCAKAGQVIVVSSEINRNIVAGALVR